MNHKKQPFPIRVLRIGQETPTLLDIVLPTWTAFWVDFRFVVVVTRKLVARPLPHVANHVVDSVIVLLVERIYLFLFFSFFEET